MKCKSCGSDVLIKKDDWYECANCGATIFDTEIKVDNITSPTKVLESIEKNALEKSEQTFEGKKEEIPEEKEVITEDKVEEKIEEKISDSSPAYEKSTEQSDIDNYDEANDDDSDEDEEKEEKSPIREAIDFLIPIIIAIIIAILLKLFVFANIVVPTGSMLNTIQEKDRIIASRIEYSFNDPERYDIAVFKFPDDETQCFIKRIIGLPGETVQIVNGVVYVTKTDGQTIQLDQSFVTTCVPTGDYGPFEVPEDCYFMMGDNRNQSWDSRYWEHKYVHRTQIIGKAKFRYYPSIGKVE